MRHKIKLTIEEKLKACLDLSDFVFKTIRNVLSAADFDKRMKHLRNRHFRENFLLPENMRKFKNE